MSMRPTCRAGRALVALVLSLCAGGAAGQTVQFRGRGDLQTDSMLKRILEGGDYRVLTADTVVPPMDTLAGNVLVLGTTIRFENVILGDLTIVDANVFLRPGARIAGSVSNFGGGFFPAPSATVEGEVIEYRDAPYVAEIGENGLIVRGMRAPSLVDLEGLWGLLPPTYDRVNGLGLHSGIRVLLPRIGSTEPELVARGDYHVERERGGGVLELGLRTPSGWHTRIGVERVAPSRDDWIHGDFASSVQFLVLGQDLRNRYDAERVYAAVGAASTHRSGEWSFTLRGQTEEAHSLTAGNPWHAWGDDTARANPAIDPGRINSLALNAAVDWTRPTFVASLEGGVEYGSTDWDNSFTAFEVAGTWHMKALADHSYLLGIRFRGPFPGSESLPRQRWSGIGGRGTLPTYGDLQRTGDRLVFVSSVYSVPIPGLDLPALGQPAFEVVHQFGSAWSLDAEDVVASGSRDLAQNLGLRLRFRLAWIMGILDPEDTDSFKITAGIARALTFPWTPREDR